MRHQVAFGFASLFPGKKIVDLFAGGGGASAGLEAATRRPVNVAINHDPQAIAMHVANHPKTDHYCEDIFAVSPRDVCGSERVGFLWASPDCTHHSIAKGGKPRDKNIRSLANVVVDWARDVRPDVIGLENVQEFLDWGPLDDAGYPIPEREGEDFRAFVAALSDLGYRVEWRVLVAADYGVPTSRKRLFMVARCDGKPIVWPAPTHGQGRSKPWVPASSIIDFSLPCPSIFLSKAEGRASGVKRPLVEKTEHRIAVGFKRYVLDAADPFIIPLTHHGDNRVHSIREPFRTITAANRGELAYVAPQMAAWCIKHYGDVYGHGFRRPVGTVTTIDHHAVGAAQLVKSSFVTKLYGTSTGSPCTAPMPTVTAGGWHLAEMRAFLVKWYGSSIGQAVTAPLGTVTTRDRFGLVMVEGEPYQPVDLGMRMFTPRELFRAMGFADSYIIDPEYNGKPLTKTQQIDKCGNSVPPKMAEVIVRANAVENYYAEAA